MSQMRLIGIAIFCALATSADAHAHARGRVVESCTSDYLYSATRDYHRLSSAQLAKLESYVASGEPDKGWATLANYGDAYAIFAAKMTDRLTSDSTFLENMLAVHWETTNSREIFQRYTVPYARQHYRQYVEILKSGVWPDSDQIVNSYLAAARKLHLPEDTVLVATWMSSCMGGLFRWQDALRLPRERIVERSNACVDIDEWRAAYVIFRDSTGIFLRTIGGLFD